MTITAPVQASATSSNTSIAATAATSTMVPAWRCWSKWATWLTSPRRRKKPMFRSTKCSTPSTRRPGTCPAREARHRTSVLHTARPTPGWAITRRTDHAQVRRCPQHVVGDMHVRVTHAHQHAPCSDRGSSTASVREIVQRMVGVQAGSFAGRDDAEASQPTDAAASGLSNADGPADTRRRIAETRLPTRRRASRA